MPHFRGAAAVLTLSLLGLLGADYFWHPPLESFPVGIASADVPKTVGGDLSSADLPPGSFLMSALPGAKMLFRTYGTSPEAIDFLLLSGTAGVALHDPRLCLSGYRLSNPQTLPVAGTPVEMQTYDGCTTTGLPDLSISYFYVVNGQVISSSTRIRAAMLENALIGRQSTPVYFFRFIEPLSQDPATEAHRKAHLCVFVAEMWRSLRPRIAPGA
jgi:hypothetical protein